MWHPGSNPRIISYKYGGLDSALTILFSDGTVYRWSQVRLDYKYILDRTEDKTAAFYMLMKPQLGEGTRILHLVDSPAG